MPRSLVEPAAREELQVVEARRKLVVIPEVVAQRLLAGRADRQAVEEARPASPQAAVAQPAREWVELAQVQAVSERPAVPRLWAARARAGARQPVAREAVAP
jgi:hypothetical protein